MPGEREESFLPMRQGKKPGSGGRNLLFELTVSFLIKLFAVGVIVYQVYKHDRRNKKRSDNTK